MKPTTRVIVWTASKILLTAWALSPPAAGAATLTVCASGCGHTTIAAAVAAAASGDTIEVQDAVHTEAGITIEKSVTIQGLGATATIVQAAATPGTADDRVFFIPGSEDGPISVTLRRMTIRHGNANGGAVYAPSYLGAVDLRIENSILAANQVDEFGGAIDANGVTNLTIVDSTITGNTAQRGSAILMFGGDLTIIGTTVSGNTDTDSSEYATILVGANFTIANSTVSGNNSAGIFSFGATSIVNTTVTANTLVGVEHVDGTLTVSNSIIWDNGTDCSGTLTIPAGAPNLDGDGTCTGFSLQNADADLEPLLNNGGPTETHALGDNSDALDAGDDAICAAAPVDGVDQRGVDRPQGADCDLGSFEKMAERVCTDIDDSDPAVDYRIGWHRRTGAQASNGGYHRRMGSNQGGNGSTPTARVQFDGDEVIYDYVKSDRGGTAKIFIDGVLQETLSYGPGQNGAENPTFGHSRTYSGLTDSRHELLIEHLTGAVYVDGFTFCGTGNGAAADAARFGVQTTVTSYPLSLLALSTTVSVGADDVHVSAVVEGSTVGSLSLLNPLSSLLGSGLQLLSGNATVLGIDAPVSSTGNHSVRAVPPLLGLLSPIQVSVSKTFRRP